MIARVKLIGSGTSRDPYRVPLPTYEEILTLPDEGYAYVSVPDGAHPDLYTHPSAKTQASGHGGILVALDADGHESWYAHLDNAYQEHAGEFRPEIA